ncbi:MAG: hypothetical protein ACUVQ0_06775 [Thermoproteota archaeon]
MHRNEIIEEDLCRRVEARRKARMRKRGPYRKTFIALRQRKD